MDGKLRKFNINGNEVVRDDWKHRNTIIWQKWEDRIRDVSTVITDFFYDDGYEKDRVRTAVIV